MKQKGYIPLLAVAWKNVSRKLFRNIVVAIAVGLLVSLLVFAFLFKSVITEDIELASRKLGADIVLVPAEAKELAEDFILESREKTFYMDRLTYEKVILLPEIDKATYQIYLDTIESGCCSIIEGQVVVFDQDSDFILTPWLQEGAKRRLASGEVYIGSYVAEYLGLLNSITLFNKELVVAGELEQTGIGLDHGLFVRSEDLDLASPGVSGQYKPGEISIAFLRLKNGTDPETVVRKIVEINPKIGIMTRANIGGGVLSTLKDIVKIFSITIFISSALAVLLAWSTFTALANERRREVGITRAIGAQKRHIVAMFLCEAVIISVFGGIFGVIAGHLLIRYLATDFELLARLHAISLLSPRALLLSAASVLIGMAVCIAGASFPILRLANMEPLQAIKEQ